LIELLDIREVLEGLVARLATQHMDAVHLQRLKKTQQLLAASARKGDVADYLEHALAFRRVLIECCQSETLADQVLSIENRLRLMGSRTAAIPGRMEASIEEHEKLLQAISRGDAAAAEQLNRERIQHIRAAVANSLSYSIL
jgi:DNA-binding GntR family transcriptional regulator